jgi:beta-N-acetylhexosaminidase
MSVEGKAAQLLMIEFGGADGQAVLDLLASYSLGGVLLKSANGNLVSSDQVRRLTTGLQEAGGIPLLVAIDQEGGRIDRIHFDDVQRFPAAGVFGLLADPALTEGAAWATGVQLASLGINVDFAPVADVNVLGDGNPAIGDRSFGSEPGLVAEMTVAAVEGFARAGVASAVKHFPGHGNTAVDSHLGLPVVQTEVDTWFNTDRVPFAAAIEAGVPMVMVGHIAYLGLDAEGLPASMSEVITEGRLRTDLGFAGVIVTDDLANMAAVAAWGPGERAVNALAAGSDLLLNPGDVEVAIAALVTAVQEGRILESTLDSAVSRILRLKFDLGLLDGIHPVEVDGEVRDSIADIADRIGEACRRAGLDC